MTGTHVKETRKRRGWTQQQAAGRWQMSQSYLSLVENGKRPVPVRLTQRLARAEPKMATGLPLTPLRRRDLPGLLGSLKYPGFAYLGKPSNVVNPATVLLAALTKADVSSRVIEALPWLLLTFADSHLNLDWLVDQAKLSNAQNRLGYLVTLAGALADDRGQSDVAARLRAVEAKLYDARLAKEGSLGEKTAAEQRHLRVHRPEAAERWNLLTNLRLEHLRHAF